MVYNGGDVPMATAHNVVSCVVVKKCRNVVFCCVCGCVTLCGSCVVLRACRSRVY